MYIQYMYMYVNNKFNIHYTLQISIKVQNVMPFICCALNIRVCKVSIHVDEKICISLLYIKQVYLQNVTLQCILFVIITLI